MAVISGLAVDVHAHFLPRSYREALDRAGINIRTAFRSCRTGALIRHSR